MTSYTDQALRGRLNRLNNELEEDEEEARRLTDVDNGILQELNTGISWTVGMVADPLVQAFGGEPRFTQRQFAELGMAPYPGQEGQGFGARMLQETGATLIPALGMYSRGAAVAPRYLNPPQLLDLSNIPKGLSKTEFLRQQALARFSKNVGPGAFDMAAVYAYQHPIKTGFLTTASVIGAVTGGFVGEELTGHAPWGRALGELFGGLSPDFVDAIMTARRSTVRGTRRFFSSPRRASKRIADLSEETPDEILRALDENILDLPPGTASGDVGLMHIQAAAAQTDPVLARRLAEREARAMNKARQELIGKGTAAHAREFLERNVRSSVANIKRRLQALGPKMDAPEANRIAREEIDLAYKRGRKAETAQWRKVPNAATDITDIQDAWFRELRRAVPEDELEKILPDYLYKFIGDLGKGGTSGRKTVLVPGSLGKRINNVKALRTRMMDDIVLESSKPKPNANKIRILSILQESALESMRKSDGGDALQNAIDFSQDLNNKFTKGFVGDLLGYERTGDFSYLAEETAQNLFKLSGARQKAAIHQVLNAAPRTRRHVENVIRDAFYHAGTEDGLHVNAANAQKFLKRHRDLLEEFPKVRDQIMDSITKQQVVDEMLGQKMPSNVSPMRKSVAVASLYMDAPAGKEVSRIIERSSNPRVAMKSLRESMKGNKKAIEGLATATGDWLIEASSSSKLDEFGHPILSGTKMLRNLEKHSGALRQVWSKQRYDRAKQIARELLKAERAARVSPAPGGVVADQPSKFLDFIAGTIGARGGARLGKGTTGASLLTAHFGADRTRDIMSHLTRDKAKDLLIAATEDDDLMKVLTMDLSKELFTKKAEVADKVISWLIIPLNTVAGMKEQDQRDALRARMERLNKQLATGVIE